MIPSQTSSLQNIRQQHNNTNTNTTTTNNNILSRHQQQTQQTEQRQRQQKEQERQICQEQNRLILKGYERMLEEYQRRRHRRESRQRSHQQSQAHQEQRMSEDDRREQELEGYIDYLRSRSPDFDQSMDEVLSERQLDQYHYEMLTPQEKQDVWDQEQLNEWQRYTAPRGYDIPPDHSEQYANYLHEQLQQDIHEQNMLIYEIQNNDYYEQCKRNQELLMQKEECDDAAFRLQQFY